MVGWGRVFLFGVGLFVLCVGGATFLGYAVNHWLLDNDLWLVIDLLIGAILGLPAFLVLFVLMARRLRRPRMLDRRRFLE